MNASTATLTISRVMRPGHEAQYDPWIERLIRDATAVHGYRAAIRLDQAGGLHHSVLQFDDRQSLDDWRGSDAFARLAAEADAFSVGLAQSKTGAEVGFALPSEAAAKKWKTAIVTWVGVVPTLLAVSGLVGWALPSLPRVAQQIVSSILLTSALTWLILPRVRSWSRFWMLQDSNGRLRKADG